MTALRLENRKHVRDACREFDELTRDAFLAKYGFGKSREYFLLLDGKHYDSKAIAGVAFGIENPSHGPLGSDEFSGGEATVARELERLGFTVVRTAPAPPVESALVLVENEVTYDNHFAWKDETGVRYHYPNKYKNRIRSGLPFIYYRGVRRAGNRRGQAGYFGVGRIGVTWRDESVPETVPRAKWQWYCEIEDYIPFASLVPSKQGDTYLEDINTPLGWQTGAREIDIERFHRILTLAGVSLDASAGDMEVTAPARLVPACDAMPVALESLGKILLQAPSHDSRVGTGNGAGRGRRSKRAKAVGDIAEELVYRHLRSSLEPSRRETIDWVAQRGLTPGWDIQYTDAQGDIVAVEVKGTVAGSFPNVELTSNEWNAAERLRDHFVLYLVARCGSAQPRLFSLLDPFGAVARGVIGVTPSVYRLTLVMDETDGARSGDQ